MEIVEANLDAVTEVSLLEELLGFAGRHHRRRRPKLAKACPRLSSTTPMTTERPTPRRRKSLRY